MCFTSKSIQKRQFPNKQQFPNNSPTFHLKQNSLTFPNFPESGKSWHSIRCKFLVPEKNKTAELSQRRPRDAPNIWVPWKFLRVLTTHPATFPEICNGLLFRSIRRMCVQNLKFVALPVPEIIGGTLKIWAVPGYAHAPFSPKFLPGFCSHGPSEYICQIWRS